MTAPDQPAVVVGIKETGSHRRALRLAAQEARYRGVALIAVIAYASNPALGSPAGRPMATLHSAGDARETAESALRAALADALGDQADGVEQRAVPGPAGHSLVDTAQAAGAQLLVLSGGGTASVLPGTVSQYVLRKAPCPILIVPETDGTEPAP
jgi:nucleotide-binding universal stress UspA family protein